MLAFSLFSLAAAGDSNCMTQFSFDITKYTAAELKELAAGATPAKPSKIHKALKDCITAAAPVWPKTEVDLSKTCESEIKACCGQGNIATANLKKYDTLKPKNICTAGPTNWLWWGAILVFLAAIGAGAYFFLQQQQ